MSSGSDLPGERPDGGERQLAGGAHGSETSGEDVYRLCLTVEKKPSQPKLQSCQVPIPVTHFNKY
jgi:hypothetical protein